MLRHDVGVRTVVLAQHDRIAMFFHVDGDAGTANVVGDRLEAFERRLAFERRSHLADHALGDARKDLRHAGVALGEAHFTQHRTEHPVVRLGKVPVGLSRERILVGRLRFAAPDALADN